MMDKGVWVYDIETLKSCFTYSAVNISTNEKVQFVIHEKRDDLFALLAHLRLCKGQIGFNNINFDYPIIHFIMKHCSSWDILWSEDIIKLIYDKAQQIIEEQNSDKFNGIVAIPTKDIIIPQLDLYKLWHYNNKARRTSLKALEISMNYPNVMEMEIPHTKADITIEEVDHILEYNMNDVLATLEFYKRSIPKIELRKELNSRYNLKCLNFSDSKIGEELTLKLYCEKTGQSIWDVKKLRSEREQIDISELIFEYISFKTPEFNRVLSFYNNKVIRTTKGELEFSLIHRGFKYDFASGGLHGCIKPGLYESDDDYMIIDADVGSLYPSIAVLNKLFPAHLGQEFCDVYEDILNQRLKAKKEGNMSISDAFKLSLNSVYGKSNDKFSFLYDPEYTLYTTINGQLMIAMLCESLVENIPDLTMLQVNTDGITVRIPRKYQDTYYTLCKEWEKVTKLQLEYVDYKKMWIRDVNNYGCVSTKGKIKNKGAFEVDKDYHKDNSFRVIPLALQEYFVNNVPIETTIANHKNIYDFCGRQKFKGRDYGTVHTLVGKDIVQEIQQKNVRYYISNKGSSFMKNYAKGTSEVINKGYQVTIFNKFIEKDWKEYDLNYSFYIKECYKEIDQITSKQLLLF